MVAERRLLIVETYVSVVATGVSAMVETSTGIGWPAAAAGGLDLQPVTREATTAQTMTGKTRRILKIWDTGLSPQVGDSNN
jgi:hypothetical protein